MKEIIAVVYEKDSARAADLRLRIAERLKEMVSANRMAGTDYVWVMRRATPEPLTTQALVSISS